MGGRGGRGRRGGRVVGAMMLASLTLFGQAQPAFRLEEATIADVHAAFRARTLTCRSLVEQYACDPDGFRTPDIEIAIRPHSAFQLALWRKQAEVPRK